MRKSNRRKPKHQKPRTKIGVTLLVFLFLALMLLTFIFLKVSTLDKFTYVNKVDGGGAEIVIIDPKNDKLVKFLVLPDTELESSRNLGDYKISSLWTLGEKEGYNGKLVVETISKNYLIPIYLWKDGSKTNLSFFQNIKALIIQKKYVDYNATFISTKLPNSVLINFVNPKFSESLTKIEIDDLTGSLETARKVATILEIMGTKITSNSKGYDVNLDCEVIGKDIVLVKHVAKNFSCSMIVDKSLLVDLKIRLGAKFGDRF